MNVCFLIWAVSGFQWVSAGLYKAPGLQDSTGVGATADDLVQTYDAGLWWYLQKQREQIGPKQYQWCYFEITDQLKVVNLANKGFAPAIDAGVPGTAAGLLVAAVVMHCLGWTALFALSHGVHHTTMRKGAYWAGGALPLLAAVLTFAGVVVVTGSKLKDGLCAFWTGPGALSPNQKSFCGYGAAFNAAAACVALEMLLACGWLWIGRGDVAALMNRGDSSGAVESRRLVTGSSAKPLPVAAETSDSAYAPVEEA